MNKSSTAPPLGLDVTMPSMPELRRLVRPEAPAADAVQAAGRRRGAQKFALAVQASPIDGQGAFAMEPIPARRKIGELRGESISVREARRRAKGLARIKIVEISERRAVDATHSEDALACTNHSCQPNAVLRIRQGRIEFYTLRDVAIGEELTVDYGPTHHDGQLPCRCGAPGCVGRL